MYTKWLHLLDKIRFARYWVMYCLASFLASFYKNQAQYKNLWIVSERGVDARDNGYHFFRYVRQTHPEVNICYIISKNSPDRKRVEELGKVINYRSFRHFLAFILSEVKVSTHIVGYSPDLYMFLKYEKKGKIKGIKIFLQHGIMKDKMPFYYRQNTSPSLFVCSAKREYEFVKRSFGHPEGVVRLLGLCRYDNLPLQSERKASGRKILLMPTWRFMLDEKNWREVVKSSWFQAFQDLLEDSRLASLLEENGDELLFYPHYKMQKFIRYFRAGSGAIKILDRGMADVQELLIQADILITDFSSVFFDFAYMGKPLLYYQFDREKFRKVHLQEGYFSYEQDGFGPVVETKNDLLEELENLLRGECSVKEPYKSRAEGFFAYRDKENCRRNYEAVLSLLKEGKDGEEN